MRAGLEARRRITPGLALAVFAAVLLTPSLGYACPVCFDANEANRVAFIVTTVFLSTLPLAMVGGFVLWFRGLTREPEPPDAPASSEAPPLHDA